MILTSTDNSLPTYAVIGSSCHRTEINLLPTTFYTPISIRPTTAALFYKWAVGAMMVNTFQQAPEPQNGMSDIYIYIC